MATLREYYFRELESFGVHRDLTLRDAAGNQREIVEKVHFSTQPGVNFISYFFPSGTFDVGLAQHLLQNPGQAVDRVKEAVETFISHPTADPEGIVPAEQPLSGRMFFYIEDVIDPSIRAQLLADAYSLGIGLRICDQRHADFLTEHEVPKAFISHDWSDKEALARPLAEKLSSMLCPVWYDEYSLRVGQSLRESIDEGIRVAGKCILVLSPAFLANAGWTKAEFNAVMGKHINSESPVVLPIWHDVGRTEVFDYSPMVADITALQSTIGIDELVRRLYREIIPKSS